MRHGGEERVAVWKGGKSPVCGDRVVMREREVQR